MYRIDPKKAQQIIKNQDLHQKLSEKHYFFGRNGIFSFDETDSIFILLERGEISHLIHKSCCGSGDEEVTSEVEKERTLDFIDSTAFEPFMKLDIDSFQLRYNQKNLRVDKVERLGWFVDDSELGGEKVFYGELMKEKMIKDQDLHEKVIEEARSIL